MAFNLHQLDNLSYDDADLLLEDYIKSALNEFVESEAGQAHVKQHPQGGYWIGTFIEMGFSYLEHTLPNMTLRDTKTLMQQILPRKLILANPKKAEKAIPELVAFWQFLQDNYKIRNAGPIRKYLRSIQSKFPEWMGDDSRGGLAKQFALQGMAEGFDMTSQAGLDAFKEHYNKQLAQPSSIIPPNNPVPDRQDDEELGPQDVKALIGMIQNMLPPELASQVDPVKFLRSVLTDDEPPPVESLLFDSPSPEAPIARQSIFTRFDQPPQSFDQFSELAEPLSPEAIATLESQEITETTPGTILADFHAMLAMVEAGDITVSGKRHHISQKLLGDINQRLSHPIDVDFKRPLQQSYPNIHGLYLLLRASRLAIVETQGKTSYLKLDPERYQQWQQFNATEQYFALLEAWLVRATPELLGDDRSGDRLEGDACLRGWEWHLSKNQTLTIKSYVEQQNLNYWPRLYNLALMGMFGLVSITPGKPDAGKGWRIRKVTPLPLGNAIFALFKKTFFERELIWSSENNPALPLNELQPAFQPYFPDWQQYFTFEQTQFRPDRHIFKVSLGKIWRKLAIAGDANLYDLSLLILKSVNFDNDHLHCFTYQNEAGQKVEIYHPYYEGGLFDRGPQMPPTDQVKVGDLPLKVGDKMKYLFDFGDDWRFTIQLESLEPLTAKPRQGEPVGEILASKGKAPEQYPEWE
ncbi:MAG: hypothetical protein RLZZ568_1415 [Cyanobacteriota bacterium]